MNYQVISSAVDRRLGGELEAPQPIPAHRGERLGDHAAPDLPNAGRYEPPAGLGDDGDTESRRVIRLEARQAVRGATRERVE